MFFSIPITRDLGGAQGLVEDFVVYPKKTCLFFLIKIYFTKHMWLPK
jgi:hypothetical protein